MQEPRDDNKERSEFVDALKKGVLLGLAALVVVVPAVRWHQNHVAQRQVASAPPAQVAPPGAQLPPSTAPGATPVPGENPPPVPGLREADFSGQQPTPDVHLMANWVLNTRNAKGRAFILVDKKDARVYVFSPGGKLQDSAPALLGAWRGDDAVPGIGDKPLSQVKENEKTTPAGRFVAEPGQNASGEDVVWVSYDLAVSMHRVRPFVASEHRLERLATLTTDDNRISFGCINLPHTFYEDVVSPTVHKYGAVIYVLPEVKSLQQVFGAYDVEAAAQQARSGQPLVPGASMQKVALQTR